MEKLPLTLPQQDIFHDQLVHSGEPVYNIGAKLRIRGAINKEYLQLAYAHVIAQHDAIRSVFDVQSRDRMVILEGPPSKITDIDLSPFPNPALLATEYIQKEIARPFDLFDGRGLYRGYIIKVKDSLHYFLMIFHHVITDGWGASLLFQRFVRAYNELISDRSISTFYAFRYVDFIKEDEAYQLSADFTKDRDYWTGKFTTIPEPIVTAARREPASRSKREGVVIKRGVYNELIALSAELKVTTFHSMLAIIFGYLARYYGNEDIAIGIPILNRSKAVSRNTVGLFMGISPLRVRVNLEDSFKALVRVIRDQLREDYRHQRFPFGQLVRELSPAGDGVRLFDVTLSYEKHDYSGTFSGTRTRVIPFTHESERVGLAVYIREFSESEDVVVDLDYNLAYFDGERVRQMGAHLAGFIHAVLGDPLQRLCDIDFIPVAEKGRLLGEFRGVEKEYASEGSVVGLFNGIVAEFAGRKAISDAVVSYSYATAGELSDRIAAFLIRVYGVEDRSPVLLFSDRCADLAICILGILKAGRAYIPIDPLLPAARIGYILEDSGAGLLIWNTKAPPDLSLSGIVCHHAAGMMEGDGPGVELPVAGPADLAYIIYTSGSTGNPKGVQITHGSLLNFLLSMQERPGIGSGDVLCAVTTYSFDISILEILLPLISGSEVYIAGSAEIADPWLLREVLGERRVSVLQATPGFFQMLIDSGWGGDKGLKVLCGGDVLSSGLCGKLMGLCAEVWNMYGPTETTIWSSVKKVTCERDSSNIGRPIHNTDFFVLGRQLELMPIGAIGEIYIGGAGLGKGYLGNEVLTKSRFIRSPFDGSRFLYRTGDYGCWTGGGEVEFHGRLDNQVKVRGYRIELGEVEHRILASGMVQQAVVVAKKGEDGNKFLIAYVKGEGVIAIGMLTDHLYTVLPEYMVPGIIVQLDELPLTPNGKTDRAALQERALPGGMSGDVYEGTPDEIELELSTIWREVLGIGAFSVEDNLFALGGHSLSAVRLAAIVRRRFGVEISSRVLFERPTVRGLAEYLRNTAGEAVEGIPVSNGRMFHELTTSQYVIWLVSKRGRASVAYNMAGVYHLEGDLREDVLRDAFRGLIERHESLRVNFIEQGGVPLIKIGAPGGRGFSMPVETAEPGQPVDLREWVSRQAYGEFDLEKDLLIRVALFRSGEGSYVLCLVVHHSIMDAWSLGILVKELTRHYNDRVRHGETPSFKPVRPGLRDYLDWFSGSLSVQKEKASRRYWEEQLKGFQKTVSIPGDGEPVSFSFRGSLLKYEIAGDLHEGLKELARTYETRLFPILTALVTILIHKYTGETDICVGTVIAGREDAASFDQIGMYASTLPLRNRVLARDTFAGLLKKVEGCLDGALENWYFPRDLVTEGNVWGLFDVMVVLQQTGPGVDDHPVLEGVLVKPFEFEHLSSRLPVTFNFFDCSDKIRCCLEFNTDIYTADTAEIIFRRLVRLIEAVIRLPEGEIGYYDTEVLSRWDFSLNF